MNMGEKGHRFDTAEINSPRYITSEEKHKKNSSRKHKNRIPQWVYKIILILILSIVGMMIWFNRSNLTPSNIMDWMQNSVVGMGIGDGFPSKIVGNSVAAGNFKSVNKEVAVTSDTALTLLNSTAKSVLSRQHSFSKPVMKIRGNRTLIYNLGGKGYQIEGQGKTLIKTNSDQNLISGAVAGNGRYALITEAVGYFGCLTAYTANGKVQFKYWFSDYYPTAVALNWNGTKAAVTAVSAKDGGLVSAVYFIDLKSEKAVAPLAVYPENLMQDVFLNGNKIIAVGDKMTAVINSDKNTKTNYNYQGMQLSAYSVDSGKTILSLVPYGNTKGSKLVVLDSNGKTTVSIPILQSAESVSFYGDSVAALIHEKVQFYSSTSGVFFGKCSAGSDAKAIALCDESSVYILGISEIRLASIK